MMKRSVRKCAACLALLLLLAFPGKGAAGPLDREDPWPRRNRAAYQMLRAPGVIGRTLEDATRILQWHGLHPRIETIRDVAPEYAGREGTVVRQLPSAGGWAMFGSGVTIELYLPDGWEPPVESDCGRPGHDCTRPNPGREDEDG